MISQIIFCVYLSLFLGGAAAAPSPTTSDRLSHNHLHSVPRALPGNAWHHEPDHPVHKLFRRDADGSSNFSTMAAVGTPILTRVSLKAWTSAYPSWTPDNSNLPAAWVNALNGAIAAGLIPNIPQSTGMPNMSPTYPSGFDPTSPTVCSFTYQCVAPGDIASAPAGVFASSFDDGPTQFSPTLLDFLESNGHTTTHFMIGVNILQNPNQFLSILNAGHDIAVHTYTHPYMTTLSNMDLLAQFGWTMQIIHDSTGGRVPKYWRPPYGDVDVRVRAIAKEIFGLTTVVWNHDSADWAQTTTAPIETAMTGFLASPKDPGLIILEHELTNVTVSGFIEAYPMIQQNGWNFQSLAHIVGDGRTYQNAQNSQSKVSPLGILAANNFTLTTSSTSSSSSSSSSTSSSSSSSPSSSSSGSSTSASSGQSHGSSTTSSPSTSPTTNSNSARPIQSVLGLQMITIIVFFATFGASFLS
ncbi:hypothetical protein CVT26_000279 [Gymnopilus dilepis]|uniref:chitin deacetylase n=1 Tax=Gymnopilus dilepis TaxID=231916 RepID=A0A409WBI2_9AGAR|nr:hypothetical protein CVT26_000279 [Gymnopilus dilepis]